MHHLPAAAALLLGAFTSSEAFVHPVRPVSTAGTANGGPTAGSGTKNRHAWPRLSLGLYNALSELPESLDDAAAKAADACYRISAEGTSPRCRVDFNTFADKEITQTTLESWSGFMQKFVTALCATSDQEGESLRIYFSDEDSAALAHHEWAAEMPPLVQFSSCSSVQPAEAAGDSIAVFFRPGAGEAEFIESTLCKAEEAGGDGLRMSVFVNPLPGGTGVAGSDTPVAGSGTTGLPEWMLDDRLINRLVPAYCLRMLDFGALTRTWPGLFTVWQEDEGEYRMIKAMDRMPSNSEVIHAHDVANGKAFGRDQGGDEKFLEWDAVEEKARVHQADSTERSDTTESDAENGPENQSSGFPYL